MQGIQELLEHQTQPIPLNSYTCDGCGQEVTVTEMTIAGGPDKGKREPFYLGCRCEDRMLAERVIENEKRAKMNRAKDVFDQNSLVNQSLLKASFENYQPTSQELNQAKQALQSFVQQFDPASGHNLLLTGTYGTGKSHLSFSASKQLIQDGYTALFLSVPKLFTKIKDTYNSKAAFSENDLLDYIANVDLLVLDDLGAEYTNIRNGADNWAHTKLFEVIDSRSGKCTIYTTNLAAADLEMKVNPRNFSRMMENTEIVKMHGRDYRKKDF
ncbi:DNA replication protein DnaC [Sporosarcina sp. NCCP-2716]|uniref:ATP-binding protein n=1 Tax=Sporosarcina sp. NCCP-2716 TaxID=2943679 RepID=UPI00203A769D|nr:ATP-binding protein [Sporosarcina sp. NCCP-2716]GKV70244.1 DNA replication protein DnaC [Sporosarcina sp. NCCP-2716]